MKGGVPSLEFDLGVIGFKVDGGMGAMGVVGFAVRVILEPRRLSNTAVTLINTFKRGIKGECRLLTSCVPARESCIYPTKSLE